MLVLYTTEDGKSHIQLRAEERTVWLTQLEMAELFATTKQNISLHLQNIFEDKELDHTATVKESLTVQIEGGGEVQRPVTLYNLEVILAVEAQMVSRFYPVSVRSATSKWRPQPQSVIWNSTNSEKTRKQRKRIRRTMPLLKPSKPN